MSVFLILLGIIAVAGGCVCVFAAGVWRRRARWWAQAPLTPIATATEGKLIRVTGQAVPSGEVGPISGRAAAIWRVDLFEFWHAESSKTANNDQHRRESEGLLAITDGTGGTVMLDLGAAHLFLIAQRDVTKLKAKGSLTPEMNALCQRLGVSLRVGLPGWHAEAQERIIAPGTLVHAMGRARIEAKTVRLTAMEDDPESCFATPHPKGILTRYLKVLGIGVALLVAGLASLVQGVLLLD